MLDQQVNKIDIYTHTPSYILHTCTHEHIDVYAHTDMYTHRDSHEHIYAYIHTYAQVVYNLTIHVMSSFLRTIVQKLSQTHHQIRIGCLHLKASHQTLLYT